MSYSGVQIEGMRNLRSTLRAAGDDLSELKAVNASAASIASARAQQWAPRSSGALAGSVRSSGTKTAGIVRAGNNRRSASGVPYAHPIHWGWPRRNITANPFLSYAAQATEPTWIRLYTDYLDKTIGKIKGI